MKKIVEIKFGSHLYGTSTPESDLDIKAVYLPSAQDILLQRVKPVISESRPKAHGEKNTADDVDIESYSPEKFLKLLAEGQIVALDMLFAPDDSTLAEPDAIWLELKSIAPKIMTKQAVSFVRYCRQQANKYGIAGSRVAAARKALEFLSGMEKEHGSAEKLSFIEGKIEALVEGDEFLDIEEIPQQKGGVAKYFNICGKKAQFQASIKAARSIAQHLMDEYGARALAAEKNEGIDWKALSHAVRVGHEAIEFFSTDRITFPRPEAKHLLDIKQGRLEFKDVAEEIENLLVNVEQAADGSKLPNDYDPKVIDDFIEDLYRKIVIQEI